MWRGPGNQCSMGRVERLPMWGAPSGYMLSFQGCSLPSCCTKATSQDSSKKTCFTARRANTRYPRHGWRMRRVETSGGRGKARRATLRLVPEPLQPCCWEGDSWHGGFCTPKSAVLSPGGKLMYLYKLLSCVHRKLTETRDHYTGVLEQPPGCCITWNNPTVPPAAIKTV